jgi:hypothetical protein
MNLHPYAIAIVARLIKNRVIGNNPLREEAPFGVPLSIWREEIAKKGGKHAQDNQSQAGGL